MCETKCCITRAFCEMSVSSWRRVGGDACLSIVKAGNATKWAVCFARTMSHV